MSDFDYQKKFEEISDKVCNMNHAAICKAILYRDSQIEQLKEYIERIANHSSVYDSEVANEGLKLIGKPKQR
jgi:hypothetical protein